MKIINNDMGTFITYDLENVKIVFSTAEKNLDFNKNTVIGKQNLKKLINYHNVRELNYLNQIHSDCIFINPHDVKEGDAIISNKREEIIGVFTADCVPVILYDEKNNVVATVHSGWQGTIKEIVLKTLTKMKEVYGSNGEDIKAFIGPHNRECCYEVSEELINSFKERDLYKNIEINKGRHLSLYNCILKQLKEFGVMEENIIDIKLCTYCNKEFKLHSYRKDKENSGRMFSYVYIK
ncbi:conserved hypothetical protein [Clostridium collagenovorans DSM 3089]|uniref:Purine nucleoside phosphorylase n=1 Tax=Clostridium collagenovorans DSM 3089 TaxID=1121306 RepID=A0A1M5SQV0_9CLOT|nr:peptidoglycan editing factor PgeF [Clostridium collagenovorans]SHH40698.1 conserved hypothetical protein [Clostridium collagenovorans DSM 3089]